MSTPGYTTFSILTIHAGFDPDSIAGDVVPPIHVALTLVQGRPGELQEGYEYGRCDNPTTNAFTSALTALETTTHGFMFPSSMSAEDTVIRPLARPGGYVVHSTDVCGGAHKLLGVIKPAEGITSEAVDLADLAGAGHVIRGSRPQVMWVEMPSNPFLLIMDIAMIAALTHGVGGLLIVDNTFATPALQHPLKLDADTVVRSTAEYMGGHSDVAGGAFILRNGLELSAHVDPFSGERDAATGTIKLQVILGHVPSPHDTYLAHCGLKTLAPHVERRYKNTQKAAEFLVTHPKVTTIHYPRLASDPGHELAQHQSPAGVGDVLSFQVATEESAIGPVTRARVFALTASLGAPESLIEHPAIMVHSTRMGGVDDMPGTLLRLAVGLEDVNDLIANLDRAPAQIWGSSPRERGQGSPGGDAR